MKYIQALICFLVLSLLPMGSLAQDENGYNLLDQVIARVNTEVILMSAFERELKLYIEEYKQQGKNPEEIEKQLGEIRAKILDGLIDQQLLTQRAKELSIDVEAQINEQLVRVMKEVACDSLDCLEQKMREVGVDINEQRRGLRMKFMADSVLGREVYGDVSRKVTEQDKKQFYDKHKEWFVVPGEVDLSRIFIRKPKDPAAQEQALAKAKEIATQLKGGGDFKALVRSKSEDPAEIVTKEGKIGKLALNQLSPEIRTVVEKAEIGSTSDAIALADGYAIFRVDARKEPEAKPYDDNEVKNIVFQRVVMEKSQDQIDVYLKQLREDAFIEIDPKYQIPGLKTASAQIKVTPYSEESEKEKKKRMKREKKEKEQQEKTAAKAKETAQK